MSRWSNFWYNVDRTLASLLGAPPQETLSSYYFGRKHLPGKLDDVGCKILDAIDKDHCEEAVEHADKLNKADER